MFIVIFCLKFWAPDYLNTQENALDHLAPCSSSPHLTGARTGPARPRLRSTLPPLIWGRREPRALSGEVVKSHAETTRRTPGRSIIPIKPHRKSFKLSKGRRSGGGFFFPFLGDLRRIRYSSWMPSVPRSGRDEDSSSAALSPPFKPDLLL